jgi:lipid-A-disaccharide synthase
LPQPTVGRTDYAQQFHLDSSKPWVTLMPGSRAKEVRMNLPSILEAASSLGSEYQFLLPVAPTLDRELLRTPISRQTPSKIQINLAPESLPALFHSRAGIIASGTATVEAAMMNIPFVMVYRVSALTYLLGRSRVKVPYFAMVNLIAGEEVVPELVQSEFTAENVAACVRQILPDSPARGRMLQGLAKVRDQLRGLQPSAATASSNAADRAAAIILGMLQSSKSQP